MINSVLSFVAPHHCCGCDKIGTLLCSDCKNNITIESNPVCIACKRPTGAMWLCNTCRLPYERAWAVGLREGILQRLVGLYKFERVKSAYLVLADILSDAIPELPTNTIIIPIPTTPSRIRERGYDHMLLICKRLAKLRNLKCQQLVIRKNNTKQRQASAQTRISQAKQAFEINGNIDPDTNYLLVDDVITTGATIKYAAKALKDAGAKHVWVAVVTRQISR